MEPDAARPPLHLARGLAHADRCHPALPAGMALIWGEDRILLYNGRYA